MIAEVVRPREQAARGNDRRALGGVVVETLAADVDRLQGIAHGKLALHVDKPSVEVPLQKKAELSAIKAIAGGEVINGRSVGSLADRQDIGDGVQFQAFVETQIAEPTQQGNLKPFGSPQIGRA